MSQEHKLKITVGVPSASEYLHRKFVESLMGLQYPANTEVQFSCIYGFQLPFARNQILEDALANNSEYIFFIDVDMVFSSDVLIKLLKHDVDVVSALAFRRITPHYPCIFRWSTDKLCYETMDYTTGLLEVDASGMACTLIKTDVVKKMKAPWYYYRDNMFSSDLTFCWNAKQEGFKIHVDTDIKIGHIGSERIITEETYLHTSTEEMKKDWNTDVTKFLDKNAKEKELYKQ